MSWSIGRMGRYVTQCKFLDQLKTKDDLCSQSFKNGKYLMFSEGKPLLTLGDWQQSQRPTIKFMSFGETEPLCGQDLSRRSTLLGIDEDTDDTALFACPTVAQISPEVNIPPGTKFSDMRMAIMTLIPKEASIVARGYSLLKWLETMKFCPTCASPLKRNVAGTSLSCEACPGGTRHYPITHPVAITRVENEVGDAVLLVRQGRHPAGMYSCIAGFLEAGESLEEAVRREVAEEAGIVIGKVEYFDSQTWPVPQNSLMLACTTRAMSQSPSLDIDKEELEDGRWFSKDEVREAFDRISTNPKLFQKNDENVLIIPPSGAIAHHLLKDWIGK